MITATAAPHSAISPTAKFVAHLRTFTDLPYTDDIARACNAEVAFNEMVGENPEEFLWTAPAVESRYLALDACLRMGKPRNIIELASGLSPRGLIWTSENDGIFHETDLPDMHKEKKGVIMEMLSGMARDNLRWAEVNATSDIHFSQFVTPGHAGDVAIIHEGLLPYLNHGEKWRVGRNIRRVLEERGGYWITPDIFYREHLETFTRLDERTKKVIEAISGFTNRNLAQNAFVNEKDALAFFRSLGFLIDVHRQRDLVSRLSSLDRVEVSEQKLEAILNRGTVWVMRLK